MVFPVARRGRGPGSALFGDAHAGGVARVARSDAALYGP